MRFHHRCQLPEGEVRIDRGGEIIVVLEWDPYPTMVIEVPTQTTDEICGVIRVCKKLLDHWFCWM